MTRLMRLATGIIAVLLLLSPGLAVPALARQAASTLYVIHNDIFPCGSLPFPNCAVTRLTRATVAPDTGHIDWVRDVPTLFDIKEAYVTPDGGTLVYLGISLATGPSLYLHDVASGLTTAIGSFDGARILLGNPARPEVYLFDDTGATALAPSGARRIPLPCRPNGGAGISADGLRASVSCVSESSGGFVLGTAVFETGSGALVTYSPYYGKVSADGSELFTRDYPNGVTLLQRRELTTGQVLAESTNPGWDLIVDAGTGDVVTYNRGRDAHLMNGLTLGARWSTVFGSSGATNGPEPVIDPSNGMLFAATDGGGVYVADTRGRRLVGYASFPALMWAQLAVGPPAPVAPTLAAPVVQGQVVQLSWSAGGPSAAVTRYLVDVGSGPGLSDIVPGLDLGQQTSFAASGVPPGRYYVRVRAGNYTGLGAPSNEIVVQVQ